MGKHIVAQRRGKGGLVYRSPSHRHLGNIRTPPKGSYTIRDIVHAPGRNNPVLKVSDNSGKSHFQIAFSGAYVGQNIHVGTDGEAKPGNTIPLGKVPDGSLVYNIESMPGDGGKFCRNAGSAALVVSHGNKVVLKLTSGKTREFHADCMATLGASAGTGARNAPVLKAGKNVHFTSSRAKRPYTVRGVAMNAINHPHGGGNHQHVGKPSTVSTYASPGRKVGRLSPRRKR